MNDMKNINNIRTIFVFIKVEYPSLIIGGLIILQLVIELL